MSTLGNVDLCPAEVFKNKQALIMTMSGIFFSQKKSLNIYDFVGKQTQMRIWVNLINPVKSMSRSYLHPK